MHINTFWKIVLKGIGLWLIINCIYQLPQLFSSLLILPYNTHDAVISLVASTGAVALIGAGAYCFIFKDEWMIAKLFLIKAFPEERINISTPASNILKIIVIVLAGWIFLESVPNFIRTLVVFLQSPRLFKDNQVTPNLIYYLIGPLLPFGP